MKRLAAGLAAVALLAALGATGTALAAGPKVYVGLFKDDAVAVIDTAQNRVVSTIAVPKGPHGLVITPDGRKVYVSSDGASTVSVIDTATDKVVASIDVGANPHGLAMSRDGRKVLVMAFGSNRALIVDTATDKVTGEVAAPQVHNGTISPDGTRAWVGSQKQGEAAIIVIDLQNMTRVGSIALDKTPRALDVSPDGRRVYFTLAGVNAIQVLDTSTNQIIAQVPVGASPHLAPPTPDGRWDLAVVQGPGELGIIDTASNTLAATVPVGKLPHWIAITSDGRTAWVANEGSNDVSVVDLSTRAVTATIPVGNAPRKIAVQPGPVSASAAPSPAAPRTVAAAAPEARDVTGRAELHVEADDYYFKPAMLRGTPGQKLRLVVENESGTLHNLTVAGQGIDRDVAPHKDVAVDVVFPASGTVAFTCKLHAALGMKGELRAAP
jgi:YVTN family beta-propeller protein